ncbi:hypothetical protein CISG_09711 [Coccidioides immitis RMSCC 3703]|uniref:HTH La-type RNA-binding domain-containing protein n=2 Tax=Coccidioides immitis TaxID=5501 RepID=A0A0J8TGW9_COCIT|nr:hypothetical protein CIRG_09806 [Coccidioides immitis RMSCC 2394]KMU72912.1 hypothetical protein CISG_09711 [Coccidioides immitis RMSCC 3703]
MATPTPKSAADMPAFSYAQAAKGLVSSTPTQSTTENQGKSTISANEPTKVEMIDSSNNKDSKQAPGSNESTDIIGKQKLGIERDLTKNISSGASSPSVATASTDTLPKEDDMSLTPNGSSDSTWDKQSQASVLIDKPNQTPEGSKEKSSENGSEKGSMPLKELRAAPIPAVNIWQQRREAQEAKVKANAALKPASTLPKLAPKASIAQFGSEARPDASKGSNRRKSSESFGEKKRAGDAPKKNNVRSHRSATEPDPTEPLPSMADTASWPTPQLAQGEEQRRAQEKVEKTERSDKEKPVGSRPHGKEKWMPVPYVPTAVFSTPLPPAARRGGRVARGSREGGAHGGSQIHGNNAGDRRATGDSRSAQGAKLNGADAVFDGESSHSDGAQNGKLKNAEGTYPESNRTTHFESSQQRQDSKSFGKSQESSNAPHTHAPRQGGPHGEGHSRYGQNAERRFESGPRSADPFKESNSFALRERDFGRDRDYQRGDFHRERDYGREHRGESRSERGRGSYRGRGGHSNYTSAQNTAFHSAPIPQHPFSTPKNFTFSNDRHRMQQSGPQNGTQGSARMGLRSPSMPNPAIYGPSPYPIQTDLTSVYGYPQIPQGPMTAVPYQPYMEQYSLMSMISMQFEYYFSVDNLCKDLFLRKHMDSQGFVLLSVIAAFKRIKSLTEDMDVLRLVCRQLKNVEYRPSEDGLDRVRKREKWDQWVLSMEMRDPSAQNEGPPPVTTSPSTNFDGLNENGMTMQQDGYSNLTNGATHATSTTSPSSSAPSLDTANSQAPARSVKLSSTAAEFSPLVPPTTQNENVSERDPVSENTFPDEQIGDLVIVQPSGN